MCDQYWQLLLTDYLTGVDAPINPVRDLKVFEPHMTYCGRVRRFVPYKDKTRRCLPFAEFVNTGAIDYHEKYQMANPNREAMTISISKYNRPQPVVDDKVLEIACDWALKHFQQEMGNTYTVDHDTARRDLDRTTSAGYPWSLFWQNKGAFLDSEEAPKIEKLFWEKLLDPQPYEAFWTASLKHELRPVEKLKENKIRTFTASATELTVATTRLCLDFNEKFYKTNNKTWSFVGCSKYNLGFDRLYRRLNKHPHAFELDETAFDSSLFVKVMEAARDLRWKMYHDSEKTPQNKKRLWEVYKQIIDSLIVLDDGTVFQKHTGNPSGSANTIVDNTLILFILFAYAYIKLAIQYCPEKATFAHFMQLVEAALNGDDNTFTVADEIVSWFNAENVAKVWSEIGIVTKSPCFKPRPLKECEFLSQSFKKHKDSWIPVPERHKALCSLMWGQEFDDVRFTLLRAYALRIETWGDEQARREIQMFIDYLKKEYKSELVGSIPDTQLTMRMIHSVWKTDAELERLYCLPPILEKDKVDIATPHKLIKYMQMIKKRLKQYPHPKSDKTFIHLKNRYEPLGNLAADDRSVNRNEVQAEMSATERISTISMPKGKGNKSAGGNPSKKELARRAAQSRRDKQQHGGKAKRNTKNFKPRVSKKNVRGGNLNGVFARQDVSVPLARGTQQVNVAKQRVQKHTHSTFIGAFTTGTDGKFTEMYSAPLQPAQQTCDPWGFVIAGRYQKWKPRGKNLCFRVRVEPRNSATINGETFIQINYDPQAGAPTTSTQLLQFRGASRANAWLKNSANADNKEFDMKALYTRPGGKPSGTDIRLYDYGNFFVFYEGFATQATYDIWMDIDVDLLDPWIPVAGEAPNIGDYVHDRFTVVGVATVTKEHISGDGALEYTTLVGGGGILVGMDDHTASGYYLITANYNTGTGTLSSDGIITVAGGDGPLLSGFCSAGVDQMQCNEAKKATVQAVLQHSTEFKTGGVSITHPTGWDVATGGTCDVSVVFLSYSNGMSGVPAKPLPNKRNREEKKTYTIDDIERIVRRMMLSEKSLLMVSEPPSPQLNALGIAKPLTAAAAGGAGAETLSKTDEKKNESGSKKGKSTTK